MDEKQPEERVTAQERAYRELMGPEALARQKDLAKLHFPCCANPRAEGHHPLCRRSR